MIAAQPIVFMRAIPQPRRAVFHFGNRPAQPWPAGQRQSQRGRLCRLLTSDRTGHYPMIFSILDPVRQSAAWARAVGLSKILYRERPRRSLKMVIFCGLAVLQQPKSGIL